VRDGDRDGRPRRGALGTFTQVGLGLDGDDLIDRGRVVPEVRAAAGAHLNHSTLQAGEQLAAMLGAAATLADLRDPRIDAGEHRMRGMFGHCSPVSVADSALSGG
jgi:hypothetical protein